MYLSKKSLPGLVSQSLDSGSENHLCGNHVSYDICTISLDHSPSYIP